MSGSGSGEGPALEPGKHGGASDIVDAVGKGEMGQINYDLQSCKLLRFLLVGNTVRLFTELECMKIKIGGNDVWVVKERTFRFFPNFGRMGTWQFPTELPKEHSPGKLQLQSDKIRTVLIFLSYFRGWQLFWGDVENIIRQTRLQSKQNISKM